MENLGKKILIVEDDKGFLWILKEGLLAAGFSIVYAEDGEDGVKKAQEEKPDLMFLDIMLPKMDGITVAKTLKEKGVDVKIIFLTNLKDVDHISQAMDASKDTDYIIKSDLHLDQIVERAKNKLGIK